MAAINDRVERLQEICAPSSPAGGRRDQAAMFLAITIETIEGYKTDESRVPALACLKCLSLTSSRASHWP